MSLIWYDLGAGVLLGLFFVGAIALWVMDQ